jgi:hypothetical protein
MHSGAFQLGERATYHQRAPQVAVQDGIHSTGDNDTKNMMEPEPPQQGKMNAMIDLSWPAEMVQFPLPMNKANTTHHHTADRFSAQIAPPYKSHSAPMEGLQTSGQTFGNPVHDTMTQSTSSWARNQYQYDTSRFENVQPSSHASNTKSRYRTASNMSPQMHPSGDEGRGQRLNSTGDLIISPDLRGYLQDLVAELKRELLGELKRDSGRT